jgi:hypothetical protein
MRHKRPQWLVLTLTMPLVLCCAVLQVDHHKRVVCLVCSSVVVPYEAYHIDAGEQGRQRLRPANSTAVFAGK